MSTDTTSLRIVMLTRQVPFAGSSGSMLRNLGIIRGLASLGTVDVWSIHMDGRYSGSAMDTGAVRLHECYLPRNWRMAVRTLWYGLLRRTPALAHLFYDPRVERELNSALTANPPDVVIFAEAWLMPYLPVVRLHCTRIIADLHDVDTTMYEKILRNTKGWRDMLRTKLLLSASGYLQPRIIAGASDVWTCCSANARTIRELHGVSSRVILSAVDASRYAPVRNGTQAVPADWKPGTRAVLFCGNFSYYPNADAARLLIGEVMPLVWKHLPDIKLLLVGGTPSPAMSSAAAGDARVIVTGYVPDVLPYLAAATAVTVPMRMGIGPRLKMLEAFAAGRPVVATPEAVESLDIEHDRHLLVGATPEELAKHLIRLFTKPELANRLRDEAGRLLSTEYSVEAIAPLVEKAVKELMATRTTLHA